MKRTNEKGPGAFALFSRFTQLRQTGTNRDDAWCQVCDSVPDMTNVTRSAFLALAKDWERREGKKYRYRVGRNQAVNTARDVPVQVSQQSDNEPQAHVQSQPQPQSPPARGLKAALTGILNPSVLKALNQQRLEHVLDQLEGDDEDYPPSNKRHPDSHKPQVRPQTLARPQPQNAEGTAPMRYDEDYFGPNAIMLAYFKKFPHPLRVKIVGEDELFIGRATANSAMSPDIDLTPVNGGNYGVSRMHAVITRRDDKLLLADLESMNCTYINGVRLLPEEYYIVKDGDEIWFAQLHCRIRFKHS